MNCYIRFVEEELIKFVKGMSNGKSFFFDLSLALFSWRKRVGIIGYWLLLNVVRVSRVSGRLE